METRGRLVPWTSTGDGWQEHNDPETGGKLRRLLGKVDDEGDHTTDD